MDNLGAMPRFDYDLQHYVADGVCSVAIEEDDFPCPKCHAPAQMMFYTAYYERYKCIDPCCEYVFSVK